jgi:uncharacterized protein (DUF1778 family)
MEKRNTTVLSISADPAEAQLITAAAQGAGESRSAWLMRIAMRECAKSAAKHSQPRPASNAELLDVSEGQNRLRSLERIAAANLKSTSRKQL